MKINRKSILAVVVTVIMVLSLLAACSSQSNNTSGTTVAEPAAKTVEQSTAAPAPQKKVHLTWLYFGNPDEQKQWTATAKAFTDMQDKIEVEYIPCANDAYTQKILTMFASHDAPDTFYTRNGETPTLLKENKLLDLTPFIKVDPNFNIDSYVNIEQINKPFMKDGKVFAIGDNDNPMLLYYNKTMITGLGFQDPHDMYQAGTWTWDEWTKIAAKVKDSSTQSKPIYAFIQDAWFGPNFLWALSNGVGSFYTADGKPSYNDPKVVEALNWIVKRLKDKTILYGASSGKGMDGGQLFQAGQIAFSSAGRWMVPTYKKITAFKWDIVPFPKGPQATQYISYTPGYTSFAINAETKHTEEAWAWFRWFVGKDGQTQNWGKGGNCLPTIKGLEQLVLDDKAYYEHPQTFLDIQKVAIWPDIPYAMNSKEGKLVDDAFQKVFMLQGDPKSTMDQLCSDITSGAAN